MAHQDQLFEIAPEENVGTQIIDPNMPSNLDFQEPSKAIEMKEKGKKPEQPLSPEIAEAQQDCLPIKEYSIKGHPVFSLPPKYPIGSVAPLEINAIPVHDLSQDQRSGGIWGIWESLVGYVKREMVIDEGYIYLLVRENHGFRSVAHWRLIDLFKVFVDLEESQLRLVVTIEGSSQLLTRDFTSKQLSNIVARIQLYHLNQRLAMTEFLSKASSTCPTSSLREYLAQKSIHESQSSEPSPPITLDIEVDIGDGRKEMLTIGASTNIQREANKFCKKYHLDPFVKDLLAQTIRDKYQSQLTERENLREAELVQELRQIYTNTHAKQVLIRDASPQKSHPFLAETAAHQPEGDQWKLSQSNKQNKCAMNSVSRLICEKYGKKNIIELRNKRSKDKLEVLRKEKRRKEEDQLKQCVFKPKINLISQRVDNQIKQSGVISQKKQERYEKLYQNYQQIESKKNQLKYKIQAEQPFKPTINFISKKIVQNKKMQQSIDQHRQSHTICKDETVKSRPTTGRKPQNRNKEGLPIGDYLYQQAKRHSKPQIYSIPIEIKALSHSDILVSALKEKKLKEIFLELSLPPHQFIEPENIPSFSEIAHTSLRIMVPLLQQIQTIGFALNLQQFIQAGMSLIDSLTPEEKYELLLKKKVENHNSFSHSQNKGISRQSSGNLYYKGIAKARQREGMLEKSRQQKVRAELQHCTFRPVLN